MGTMRDRRYLHQSFRTLTVWSCAISFTPPPRFPGFRRDRRRHSPWGVCCLECCAEVGRPRCSLCSSGACYRSRLAVDPQIHTRIWRKDTVVNGSVTCCRYSLVYFTEMRIVSICLVGDICCPVAAKLLVFSFALFANLLLSAKPVL